MRWPHHRIHARRLISHDTISSTRSAECDTWAPRMQAHHAWSERTTICWAPTGVGGSLRALKKALADLDQAVPTAGTSWRPQRSRTPTDHSRQQQRFSVGHVTAQFQRARLVHEHPRSHITQNINTFSTTVRDALSASPADARKPCRGWSGGSSVIVDDALRAPATHRQPCQQLEEPVKDATHEVRGRSA